MSNFPIVGAPVSTQTLQGTLTIDQDPNFSAYTFATNTTGFTLTAAQCSGGQEVSVRLTGTLASAQNVQLPTGLTLVPLTPTAYIQPYLGYTYTLKIINSSAGAFAWTVTTNTGVTLNPAGNGSVTIAQNTQRVFLITVTSQGTYTAQDVSP